MNNYAFGMPAGPAPLFKALTHSAPTNTRAPFASAMLEAAKNKTGILTVTNDAASKISLQQIADQLFDGDTTLARRLVDAWDLKLDADNTMSIDVYDVALIGTGIPLDIQKDYENSTSLSVKRLADEYFAGNVDDARSWALAHKVYPLPSGRYSRPAVEDELDTKVFTEAARKHSRVLHRQRMKFMASNSIDAGNRRHHQALAAELALMESTTPAKRLPLSTNSNHDAVLAQTLAKNAKAMEQKKKTLNVSEHRQTAISSFVHPINRKKYQYDVMCESSKAPKIDLCGITTEFFHGNRLAAVHALNLTGMTVLRDKRSRWLRSDIEKMMRVCQ